MNQIPLGEAAWLDSLYANEPLIFQAAFLIVGGLSLLFLCIALTKCIQKKWDSIFFILLCGAIFEWALCSFLAVWLSGQQAQLADTLAYAGAAFLPALLCLHTWRQVSYKSIPIGGYVLAFVVPVLLVGYLLYTLATGAAVGAQARLWGAVVFFLYAFIAVIRSYLLCFNVFYQMPKHMRRTTHTILAGISALAILLVVYVFLNGQAAGSLTGPIWGLLLPLAAPIALVVLASTLFDAFFVTPSDDVIVTSRDFVFGNLSTVILILSNRMRVLDWNKKNKNAAVSLPAPKYKESMDRYRARLIEQCRGRVSPHDENIITCDIGGKETHYMFTTHEIGYEKRRFGYLVEIAEVTTIYSILRYLEESAMTDQFTGLYNRNAYIAYVRKLNAEQMPLSILVGDVNQLKQINDMHGHLVGDELLSDIADAIRQNMPQGSFAARIGGDEFALLVPGGDDETSRRFIDSANADCAAIYKESYGTPSVSWGYAHMGSLAEEYNDVFAKADAMMYQIKKEHFHFSSSGIVPAAKE